jgi:GT2 family glycosyltransferase
MSSGSKGRALSIVLGSYNRRALIEKTIESVRSNGIDAPYEMIVVDGGSTDGTLEWLVAQKDIITIVQHNRGEFRGKPVERRSWGYFMNLGFKTAEGKYILMVSDDCLLLPGAVNNGLKLFSRLESEGRKIGGVAFYFRNWPREERYYVQRTLGGKLFVNHGLFLKKAVEEVGWIDEETYAFYKADGDLCLRMWQAGYEFVDCPEAIVEHYYDETEEARRLNVNETLGRDRAAYLKRWEGVIYRPDTPYPSGPIYTDYVDKTKLAERTWVGGVFKK